MVTPLEMVEIARRRPHDKKRMLEIDILSLVAHHVAGGINQDEVIAAIEAVLEEERGIKRFQIENAKSY